jgi:methionyl-tRNA formyltransferase
MKKLNTIFCGTPEFSISTLEALHNNSSINMLSVISMPDKPVGRGKKIQSPPVAEYAKANNIKLFQTENINKDELILKHFSENQVDIMIVLAFSQFLSSKVLNTPTIGCFNIHTSLLPKYRGAAPIQYAILNGDTQTGICIQKMVKQMDAGDLVYKKIVDIDQSETGGQLFDKLKLYCSDSIKEFITMILSDSLKYTPQKTTDISFAPVIKKHDGQINFSDDNSTDILNKIRAFTPWPGTFFYLNDITIKVHEAVEDPSLVSPGKVNLKFNSLIVGTKDRSIRLTKVQMPGKKPCTDIELLNGLKNKYVLNDLKITLGV